MQANARRTSRTLWTALIAKSISSRSPTNLTSPSWNSCFASTISASHRAGTRRYISSTAQRCSDSNSAASSSSSSSLPWFVEEEAPPTPSTSSPKASHPLTLTPPSPPAHLPSHLHPLHHHLVKSPFLDPHSIAYIDAQAADPGQSWTDWVVVASLRKGRERGLRGAVEGIRSYLASNPIVLSTEATTNNDRAFAPSTPTISGLPTAPSRHARSRNAGKGGSSASPESDWAMVDAGDLVVHVMTPEAREVWGIEGLWERVGNASQKELVKDVIE